MSISLYPRVGKRLFDLAITGLLSLLLSPVFVLTSLLVRKNLGRPVLFRQKRPGRDGKLFTLFKFRSMLDARDENQTLKPDASRLNRFGIWLRASSLDELPELWNVLRGDMSLVGPRPLLAEYLPRYTKEEWRRHDVRPGITGWAQVNGRNEVSWEEKFALDVWYVDNVSFRLDILILWRTVRAVLTARGVSASGHVSAPEFRPEV